MCDEVAEGWWCEERVVVVVVWGVGWRETHFEGCIRLKPPAQHFHCVVAQSVVLEIELQERRMHQHS